MFGWFKCIPYVSNNVTRLTYFRLVIRYIFKLYENPKNIPDQIIREMNFIERQRYVAMTDEDLQKEIDSTDVVDQFSNAWGFWEDENPHTGIHLLGKMSEEDRELYIDKICVELTLEVLKGVRDKLVLLQDKGLLNYQLPG